MAFPMARPLEGSGRFTSAKVNPASNADPVSAGSAMAEDRLTGARGASEGRTGMPACRVRCRKFDFFNEGA